MVFLADRCSTVMFWLPMLALARVMCSINANLQPPVLAVGGEAFRGRAQVLVGRKDHVAAGQGGEETRGVGGGGYPPRHNDDKGIGNPHHAVIEGPVTELAQGHAVANVIVAAFAPGDDMGGIHHRMPLRRDDPNPAQGAAMFISLDHHPAEALVPSWRVVGIDIQGFGYLRLMLMSFGQ